jgi:hypothetical protein
MKPLRKNSYSKGASKGIEFKSLKKFKLFKPGSNVLNDLNGCNGLNNSLSKYAAREDARRS